MKVLYRIVTLILTLLTIDSETEAGIAIFQFSSDLVFAIAKIQTIKGVRIPLNDPHPYTPDARHPAWHNLQLLHGVHKAELPRLHHFVRNAKLHRQNLIRQRRAKLVILAKCRNRAFKFRFDKTLGFPGEGWTGWSQFKVATWNTHSLTKERFKYAKSLGYDILALTELWRHQGKYQSRSNEFIASEPELHKKGPQKGKPIYPDDRAACRRCWNSLIQENAKESSLLRISRQPHLLCQAEGPGM